jgi:DNA-binding CsgD family transcriptional regulator
VPASPAGAVLVIIPNDAVSEELHLNMRRIGATRVLLARSLPTVLELLPQLTTGVLAVVSSDLGPDTDEVIRLLKDADWPRILVLTPTGATGPAISAVAAGATGVLATLGIGPDPIRPRPGVPNLSAREIEVLSQVADGWSNKQIGHWLAVSPLTVKSHLARIGRKLGVGDRAHMVAIAHRTGILT